MLGLSDLLHEEITLAANNLFKSMLLFVADLYEHKVMVCKSTWSRNKQLAETFIRLVYENAADEHDLNFYASEMCVTPHYLGTVIKQETGETAKEQIDKMLITLIQEELRYGSNPLKEISRQFHFQSLSSFCKFFKRRTGITPNSYRRGQSSSQVSQADQSP